MPQLIRRRYRTLGLLLAAALAALLALYFALPARSQGTGLTIYVDAINGSNQYNGLSPEWPLASIHVAIWGALSGDTVIVAPGVYNENIDFCGKAVHLTSTDPFDSLTVQSTIIDGGATARTVVFNTNETAAAILEGFTIRNGYYGGVYIGCGTGPSILRNRIVGNWPGVYAYECAASALLEGNVIAGNSFSSGGGIYAEYSTLMVAPPPYPRRGGAGLPGPHDWH